MIKIGVESPIQLALVSQEAVELEIQVQPPLELMLAHNDVTKGDKGDSAYIIAVKNGFVGTEQQWEESLNGTDGIDGIDGREVELQTTSTYIQWRYVGDTLWTNLIALSSLEGQDGRPVEIQSDGEYIQWRLVGDATWIDIIPIADLKGADGKSAYQSYLDTTSDVPPLSESEWANLCSTKVSEAPIDGIDYVRQNGTWVPFPEIIEALQINYLELLVGLFPPEFNNGNSSSAKNIDWNKGQNQKITLTASCTVTLQSFTGTGRFQIKFIQDSVGGRSVTFSGQTVKNPSNFDFSTGQPYQECIATFYWDGGKYIMLSTPYYS